MYWGPIANLQIVDSIHKLQEHVPKLARSPKQELRRAGWPTMIHFASLLRSLACASRWRRPLRLDIVPIARPSLFHYIGAYYSRVSIELRRALWLSGWLPAILDESSYTQATWLNELANTSRNNFVYPLVSYLLPKPERFARPDASGCVVLQSASQQVHCNGSKCVSTAA